MPAVERSVPPYLQVARNIRQRIVSGELREGDTIPSTRQLVAEFEVSLATAAKALATVRAEGLVRGIPGTGTIVSAKESLVHSPRDRLVATRRTGRIYPQGQQAQILGAKLTVASNQVADALGLPVGSQVIIRRRVTSHGEEPVSASTSYFDGALAEIAPLLLVAERIVQGTPGYIAEMTGRTVAQGHDQLSARAATAADADALGVKAGSPVLAGRNWSYDATGTVVEYGESVNAPDRWSSYDYDVN